MLITIEQVFSQSEVTQIRQHLDQGNWISGNQSAGQQASIVKQNLQLDDTTELSKTLSNEVLKRLGSHPTFLSASLADKIYPPKFNHYQNSGHYGLHVDSAVMTHPYSGEQLRTDLSATLFLSGPSEYEGGELLIETEFGAQEVKLNAGDLILYPSSSLHQVTPVTSGDRICAFFWVQSLVRDNSQRTILYELDNQIQSLSKILSESNDEVLSLTHIYHNLLRQWAH